MVVVKRAMINDNCGGASSSFGQSLCHTTVVNVNRVLPLIVGDVEDVSSEVLIVNPTIKIVLQVVYREDLKFIYLLV